MSIYFGAFSQHCTQGRPIGAAYMPTLDQAKPGMSRNGHTT